MSFTTASAAARKASAGTSAWTRFHTGINHAADSLYFRLGYWVARHSKLTLLVSAVVVVLCCAGFVNFSTETNGQSRFHQATSLRTDGVYYRESTGTEPAVLKVVRVTGEAYSGEELWVPKASQAKKDEVIVSENFEIALNFANLLVAATEDGGSVLTKRILDIVFQLDEKIRALETSGGSTYADICVTEPDGVSCSSSAQAITRFWNNDFETYQNAVETDADVLSAINVKAFPDGQTVVLEAIFGNSAAFDANGAISGAGTFLQSYLFQENDDTLTWEADYQSLMAGEVETYANAIKLTYLTGRSIDDALAASISGEIFLFAITYIIMVLFVLSVLGRCLAGPVRRRTCLGLGGVFCVLAAGLAAYGLNSGFGVPFTSLVQVLPFILIGIGVDDMFVIVAAFDHTDPDLSVEERVALALKRCGFSITYTSLTNFVAFMLGATSCLPAVEYFCLYAGTAILFDFFLQVTAFVAFLAMDAKRQKAGKLDWLCCFTSKKLPRKQEALETVLDISGMVVVSFPVAERATARTSATTGTEPKVRLGRLGTFVKEKYTPFILSSKGQTLVLLGTAGLLAAGIYGITQVAQGFDVIDLAPDDHFARYYTEASRKYALEYDTQYVPLNIYTFDVDYTSVTVQASIQATDEQMVDQTYVQGPLQSWLASFLVWANSSTEYSANLEMSGGYSVYEDPDTFYTALSDFLGNGSNARFESDIIYDDDGLIKVSRSEVFLNDIIDAEKRVESMQDARDVTGLSDVEPEPIAFTQIFVLIEQFLVIYDELIINFILALVAIAVLSLVILGKVTIVALVCCTVAMIDVELLGFVYHYGLEVNGITVIQLIMAVGLVVDYTVHVVHYFLHQSPAITKDAQIANALGEIGPSVMVGAATTFFGIMPLAFASNFVFRVFFKIFIIIILFGFFHGVVFVPVALSLLPDRLVSPVVVKTEFLRTHPSTSGE